jgi:TPR repeat protein
VSLAVLGTAVVAPAVRAQEPPKPTVQAGKAAPAAHASPTAPPGQAAPAAQPGAQPGGPPPKVDVAHIKAQADAGNAEAQVAMGVGYRSGQAGLEKDPKQARAWFEKAAAQQHPAALRMLGDMYAKGEGGKKDPKKALENWQGAEKAGDPFAPILVADQLFADMTGGKKPGSGKFKIAPGTPVSRMDDISSWYQEAAKRDPRADVRQRAELAVKVLAQIKVGLQKAKHPA